MFTANAIDLVEMIGRHTHTHTHTHTYGNRHQVVRCTPGGEVHAKQSAFKVYERCCHRCSVRSVEKRSITKEREVKGGVKHGLRHIELQQTRQQRCATENVFVE